RRADSRPARLTSVICRHHDRCTLLRQRAANELHEISAVANQHADRYAVVPLLKEEPIGAERLRALIHPQA
ncbi:arsenite-activated ATPase ArsA, partial [Alcaligenes faecalis subsp. faecalis NCIB 8687]